MKTKFIFAIILFFLLTGGCQDNPSNNTDTNNEIGNTVIIDCEQDGKQYQMNAFAGHVVVYFYEGIDETTAKTTIESLNGKILEQSPEIGYYLVDAGDGNENSFIEKIYEQNVEFAALDIIYGTDEALSAKIIDNFTTKMLDGKAGTHGERVAAVFSNCSGEKAYKTSEEYGYSDKYGNSLINGERAIQEIKQNSGFYLYNMSFGYSILDKNGKRMKWKDMDDTQKESYREGRRQQIKQVIVQLSRLKREELSNTVVTISAGNEGMPDFYNEVLRDMFIKKSTRPGSKSNKFYLDEREQSILKNNILILTASDSKNPSYSNKSSKHYAMADVDISKLEWQGTSFAAPKALCDIANIMKEKNLTATEALTAAKASIDKHGGQLIYDKVKDETTGNIEPIVYVSATSKLATITVTVDAKKIIGARKGSPTSVGFCISTSSRNPTDILTPKAYNNSSNYSFSYSVKPQTLYFVCGAVHTTDNKVLLGNVTSFVTPPEEIEGISTSLDGINFNVRFFGFNQEDGCCYEGVSGILTFTGGTINNGNILFVTNKGTMSGKYVIYGNRFNIEYGDVLLTGSVAGNYTISGSGKHYAAGETIHNFSWSGHP